MKTKTPRLSAQATWRFPVCPEGPDWSLDFDSLVRQFACLRQLSGVMQDPIWHAEGDALTHTRMVCHALVELDGWRVLPEQERHIIFAAAVLHDIGKARCTREEDGRIVSPGHSQAGARMARRLLLDGSGEVAEAPFTVREQICALVRYHMLPPRLVDKPDPVRAIITASMTARLDLLCILVEADLRGRIAPGLENSLEGLSLFEGFAKEQGCWDEHYPFASAQTRFRYFRSDHIPPTAQLFNDDDGFVVTVMSGIPGAGKDTWVKSCLKGLPDLPVVSLDDIRGEIDVAPDEAQTAVLELARERAKTMLRSQTSFIWNATNTTRMMRNGIIGLMSAYGARIRLVYVESTLAEIRRRNATRAKPVPGWVIEKIVDHLDIPDLTEAHEVIFAIS